MYSLLHKRDKAHDQAIWTCAWSRIGENNNRRVDGASSSFRTPTLSKREARDYVITGGSEGLVKIWEVRDDMLWLRHELSEHFLGILSVAISSDGKTMATSSLDSSLRIWDLVTGCTLKNMETGPVDVWTVAYSPDDKYVVSATHIGKIHMYGVESGKLEQTMTSRGKFSQSIAYSPDGKYIASGDTDGFINIFDVEKGKRVHSLEGFSMPVRGLSFSPDSRNLCTAADSGLIKLYDVQRIADSARTLRGHKSNIQSVAYSPNGLNIVSSSSDKTVIIWEASSQKCLRTLDGYDKQVHCARYNPDGNRLVCVSGEKIYLYDCL